MLSPAERAMRITLSGPSSRICAIVITRRPNSTSTSTGTSARSVICSSGVMMGISLDQIDRVLAQFIDSIDHFGVGLVAALVNDQIGELRRDIDGRRFHRAALNGSTSSCPREAYGRKSRQSAELIVIVACRQ